MKNVKYLPPIAIITAAILWSVDGYLRQNLYNVSSLLIVLLEHLLAAIIFLPLLIKGWGEVVELRQRSWISVIWVSVFGGLLGTYFYTKALSYVDYIDLSVVVLLQKFQPFFAIALAAVILKEPLTRRYIISAIIATVGGYLVTFPNAVPTFDANEKTIIASMMALIAAFAWGSSTVLGKHALKRLSFFTLTAMRLWITALVAIIAFAAMPIQPDIFALTTKQWLIILTIVLSTGSIALAIYYYGLKHIPATHATIYELFWPLSAVLLEWFVRDRTLTPTQFVGGIFLIGASILLSKKSNN